MLRRWCLAGRPPMGQHPADVGGILAHGVGIVDVVAGILSMGSFMRGRPCRMQVVGSGVSSISPRDPALDEMVALEMTLG